MKPVTEALDVQGASPARSALLEAWTAQAVDDGDPGAALRMAREALIAHPERHRSLSTARAWLDEAILLGGEGLRWGIAEAIAFEHYPEADVEHVRWVKTLWGRAVRGEGASLAPGVRIDPALLGPIFSPSCSLLTQSWSVAVRTSDVAAAGAGLAVAAQRFMLIGETGQESTADELDAHLDVDDAGGQVYTPNYVSDPSTSGDVVEVFLDCAGVTSARMARRVLQVALEECFNVGLRDAELRQAAYHLPQLELPWDEDTGSYVA
jgi:hypothetical protein